MLKSKHSNATIPQPTKATFAPLEATILFADIIDFTRISADHTPAEVVASLNTLFSLFDLRAAAEGIMKIKTIGDSYMAALSSPLPKNEQIYRIVKFGTGLYQDLETYNLTAAIPYRLRIGLNSGDVIAHLDEKHSLIHDLWGDTVNVASRMEHAGQKGTITVTSELKRLARGMPIIFENPRPRHIKGKGLMTLYNARLKS